MLTRQCGDPQIIGRNWCALTAQHSVQISVVARGLFVRPHQVHLRRGHKFRQIITVGLHPPTGGETGQQFTQDNQRDMNLYCIGQSGNYMCVTTHKAAICVGVDD